MAQGIRNPVARINGQVIIDELIRNMELGQFEMAYSVLLPCIFSIFLHPEDHARLAGVHELIIEDARRALGARMAELNGVKAAPWKRKPRKQYRIARKEWWIELLADSEGAVPQGDVEIHSELNELPQPGYRGTKTTLIGREPSVTAERPFVRSVTRRSTDQVYAEIRYEDDAGPQSYLVTTNEVSIGRGGDDLSIDLPLYASEEVSREHLRLKRDPASGRFTVVDRSRNGTWLNGRRLTRGAEVELPDRAEIGVAEVITLTFEVRR